MNIRLIWSRSALTPTEQSLFGFVFFRQVKDESISRGYLQKSIVLISSVPYINLFKEVRASSTRVDCIELTRHRS